MTTDTVVGARRQKTRVLLVDDHPLVRRGLADVIGREPDLEVCGEASDVTDAMEAVDRARPDLVVVDLSLKSGHGIDLIGQIRARSDRIKVLVSSMHDEMLFAERVLRAGALGYVTKQESPDTLLAAIRQVLRNEVYLSPRMTSRLLHRAASGGPGPSDPLEALSNREIEVFERIGQGLTTQQIARHLELSPKTVETHREKIKQKLNLKNSAELSRRAVQWVLEHGGAGPHPQESGSG
jgi:DNA-binding NarL/FixJ family response regulator